MHRASTPCHDFYEGLISVLLTLIKSRLRVCDLHKPKDKINFVGLSFVQNLLAKLLKCPHGVTYLCVAKSVRKVPRYTCVLSEKSAHKERPTATGKNLPLVVLETKV